MALTNEDLQAIANLMGQAIEPINNRLDKIEAEIEPINSRLDKLESEVSALRAGQLDIRKDIKQVDKRVSDTYNLALEAWGTSTENRKWLETANQ